MKQLELKRHSYREMEVLSRAEDGCQDYMPAIACPGEREVESI